MKTELGNTAGASDGAAARSEARHTPGPWMHDAELENIVGDGGRVVVYETGAHGADINLICAAPELLDALRDMLSVAWDGDPRRQADDPLCIAAGSAIAKAEGKS